MKSIQTWFDEYAESHQNATNKAIHWICIPAIYYSIFGMLASIPSGMLHAFVPESWAPYAHWGTVVVIPVLIFYAVHSIPMFFGMLIYSVACLVLIQLFGTLALPLWLSSLIIFVVAWIGQFYGHKVEGKKPSFFQDMQFLLIGPAWLMGFVYQKLGIRY